MNNNTESDPYKKYSNPNDTADCIAISLIILLIVAAIALILQIM